MNDIKVSVIIPIYNAEKYIESTLRSISDQSLKEIEIICVDDGSTDESLTILNKYKRVDKRITVLTQKHTDAGAARNKGLEIARGEYLSFIDVDDFFEKDMLEKAYTSAKAENADILVFRSDKYNEQTGSFEEALWTIREEMLPDKEVFSHIETDDLFNAFSGWAWDKLFKRSFIDEIGMCFQSQMWINDRFFVTCALARAERICVLNDLLAHKRVNNSGALTEMYYQSGRWKYWFEALLAIKDQFIKWGIFEENKKRYISFAAHILIWNLEQFLNTSEFVDFFSDVKDDYLYDIGLNCASEDEYYDLNDYYLIQQVLESDAANYRWERQLKGKNSTYLFPFEIVPKDSQIILYGAGRVGREYYRQVRFSGWCNIAAWVDCNYNRYGAEVIAPELINDFDYDLVVIAINEEKSCHNIIRWLNSQGITPDKLIWRKAEIELDY